MLLSLCKSMSLVHSDIWELGSGPDNRTLASLLHQMQVQWYIQSLACARTQGNTNVSVVALSPFHRSCCGKYGTFPWDEG